MDAIIIDHGEYIINYGEINSDSRLVEIGDIVRAGQVIGKATGCSMLHFELYDGLKLRNKFSPSPPENIRWKPPTGSTVPAGIYNYCKDQNFPTPPELRDPTDFLLNLEGKMCG